jgi:hypothetical protein
MRNPIRACILGTTLIAVSATVAADPISQAGVKGHSSGIKRAAPAAVSHTAAISHTAAVPAISWVSTVPGQVRFLSPLERDYSTGLAQSITSSPAGSAPGPEVHPGEPSGPLNQAVQVDSYGLIPSPIHPQLPPLVSIADWNFSAAAHVPVTHGHDTGAAISAQHEF